MTKTCARCDKIKPLSDFWRETRMADGYRNWCKDCKSLPPRTFIERFLSKVTRTEECWFWHGAKGGLGYGLIQVGKRSEAGHPSPALAHRVSYELYVGPIPDGLTLDHTCHNADATCAGGSACLHRACVNPDHLEPVTGAENTRRGFARTRVAA